MACFGSKKVLILIAISMFNYAVLMGAEASESVRMSLSLAILYHQKSDSTKDMEVDNGAISSTFLSVIQKKTPTVLMNGVVAYPLIFISLLQYLQKMGKVVPKSVQQLLPPDSSGDICEHFKSKGWWRSVCESDEMSTFLDDYTPYLVKAADVPGMVYAEDKRPLSHERFVLFISNVNRDEIEQAFNVGQLQRVDLNGPDMVDQVVALLAEIRNHHENSRVLARTIMSIFNRAQEQFSWNILIFGHGFQMEQKETSLLARFSTEETAMMPDIVLAADEHERMKQERSSELWQLKKQLEEKQGALANMPPRQFALLLDFFSLLPVNVVVLVTCYGGGYNAYLVKQTLDLIDALKLRESHQSRRNYIFISQAAFDEKTPVLEPGVLLKQLDDLFQIVPRPDDEFMREKIREIMWQDCKHASIMLMPKGKLELITRPECLQELIDLIAAEPLTLPYSIELLDKYAKKYAPSVDVVRRVFEKALNKHNMQLADIMLKKYFFDKQEQELNIDVSTLGEALMHAVQENRLAVVELLLAHGADVNMRGGEFATTPLNEAIRRRNFAMVKVLLGHGVADLNDALEDTIQRNLPDILQLLLDHGAVVTSDIKQLAMRSKNPHIKEMIDKGAVTA